MNIEELLKNLKFDEKGLIPVIVQDYKTGRVLMLAYMNEEALRKTVETKEAWYFSRSRNVLWHKGETSGHFQKVLDIAVDCDNDTLLLLVEQIGVACHTGNFSCFYRSWKGGESFLFYLENFLKDRKEKLPEGSYTANLFREGKDRILQKLGEEAIETIIAGMNENKDRFIYEASDLFYHFLLAMIQDETSLKDIIEELIKRHKP
ncbi:MAG TPA: bifunctional phosphoribosyl-AMP cyclohydrolase/phosphoribosyl-ATP diphosphatase HisIE [Dictyoglomaceae bacterium]|nr:bifunctional phosphoribosyl-AMP cyclohydrolase/phosphoribosyl-ATP diphosphatase HisIE [Dictyoglomaceae bacterium]HOL38692.1 bifunctional phosphoribosyl-AMP cyclohydrolase/phosphoribosyl-ATP diphosphatase HisIE [Dictyoglomaceae bacterium]HPP15559.1 bifunctional phosphoribosyl-AMP cyclohydrolase/phosphoribosyl-ATP diphosphatase HisIE [Dictyoglomaceae bacterium]HPU42874.1 bifunctional phosphoribosyl-AMP cyclohydrolase/phosphoribosyl-ATP diphosphatase HisIE [Dictyoglomaceae bacterium]